MSYYIITSRLNGLALDIEGGSKNQGARVFTWTKHGGDNQIWYDDPGTGTIRSKLSGLCLDIEGDGTLRVMPYQPGDANQQWERTHDGLIRNRVNHKALDIAEAKKEPGARIIPWDVHGGPNQQWNFETVGGGAPQTAAMTQRREFRVVSEMHGKVLDVKGNSTSAGADLIVWSKGAATAKNQLWYLDGQGYIRSALTDFALDAKEGKDVHMQPFNGGPTQQWVIEGKLIKNRSNGQVLDIERADKKDGADVCSYTQNNQANQHWTIEYV